MRKLIRIAVIAPSNPQEFFDLLWKGVASAAQELSPLGVQVEIFRTDGHDIPAQQRLLGKLLTSSPAALALVPAHDSSVNHEIRSLVARNIPVVTFHADAPDSGRTCYVGTDPERSGILAGELLAKLMRGAGTVASFPGSFETVNLSRRYVAFRNELKRRAPFVREAVCHSGLRGLEEAAARTLTPHSNVHGIYVGSPRVHLVGEAMERAGLHVPCVGFDNTAAARPFLERGTVSAVIDESPYQQGYLAIQHAYEAAEGRTGEASGWIRVPAGVVFSANAEDAGNVDVRGAFEALVQNRSQRITASQELIYETNARLAALAETDPLTGVLNRKRFEEVLTERSKDQQNMCLLVIGLDGFAQTLPGPGNHVNDEAVQRLAGILSAHCGPQDYCARLTGCEFGILMPGASHAQAAELREKILAVLEKTFIAPRTLNLDLQVSIGIASMPVDALAPEDLLVFADKSMYAQRRSGGRSHSLRVPVPGTPHDLV